MAKQMRIEGEGVVVTEEAGVDAAGAAVSSMWRCRPDQAEKHLATWNDTTRRAGTDEQRVAMPAQALSAGDASAIRDIANEFRKQGRS